MTNSPPTRFENYPPEPATGDEGNDGVARMPAVDHRPVPLPAQAPPVGSANGVSRRAVLSMITVAVGVVVAAAVVKVSDGPVSDAPEAGVSVTAAAGSYSTSVPEGWEVRESGESRLLVESGANFVVAYPDRWLSPYARAAEELPARVRRALSGTTYVMGTLAAPADMSEGDVQRAVLSGSGTYQGRAATVWADLWVRDRAALMVVRVVTAGSGSAEAVAAEHMTDELSEEFR